MTSQKGFTLIELMIAISMVGILAGVSAPVGRALKERNDLTVAKSTVVQALRHAQLLSQASEEDTAWGVRIESGQAIIFGGQDKIFAIPKQVVSSGLTEVVFAKLSGLPQNLGTITLTINSENEEITINQEGMLEH